ncbi:MAG: hypothetical protein K6B75_05830 [Lachnospiraceae bacterium]|nr:hypothetical protein [Lachnospiraceae bacterium]
MKNKKIYIFVSLILLLAFVLGATSLIKVKNVSASNGNDKAALVGIFITTERISAFDFEGYVKDYGKNIINGETGSFVSEDKYAGRVYGRIEEGNCIFEGYEDTNGILLVEATVKDGDEAYYTSFISGDINDAKTAINVSDNESRLEMSGTVYVVPREDPYTFFVNPVFQDTEGRIYLVEGSCSGFSSMHTGFTGKLALNEESTINIAENGEYKEKKCSCKCEVTVNFLREDKNIKILQFDENSNLLKEASYSANECPEEIVTAVGTAYIVAEKYDGEEVNRTLYEKKDNYITTFTDRGDGICNGKQHSINWGK